MFIGLIKRPVTSSVSKPVTRPDCSYKICIRESQRSTSFITRVRMKHMTEVISDSLDSVETMINIENYNTPEMHVAVHSSVDFSCFCFKIFPLLAKYEQFANNRNKRPVGKY